MPYVRLTMRLAERGKEGKTGRQVGLQVTCCLFAYKEEFAEAKRKTRWKHVCMQGWLADHRRDDGVWHEAT